MDAEHPQEAGKGSGELSELPLEGPLPQKPHLSLEALWIDCSTTSNPHQHLASRILADASPVSLPAAGLRLGCRKEISLLLQRE